MTKRLVIIDGKSVFYRGYYAMPNLSTAEGTPTGGVYGFAALSLEIINNLKPDYVCVAWDKAKTNIRRRLEIYPDYKAGRKPAPADFYAQIPILKELLDAFSWPLYELDDYEADDIMAAFAHQATQKGIESCLITSDLDALQAINPLTHVYAMKKGLSNIERFDPEAFEKKYGIRVDQFLDLKALKGDSSDNIPGVPGIGEKTAVQLLQQFQTLDGIYENLWQVKDSVRRKLESGKQSASISKQVGELMLDVPLDLDLEAMDVTDIDVQKVREILQKLEFRSLVAKLPANMRAQDEATATTLSPAERLEGTQASDVLAKAREVVVYPHEDELWISHERGKVVKLNLEHAKQVMQRVPVVAHDAKALLKMLLVAGYDRLPEVHHDIAQGSFLLNPLRKSRALNDLIGMEVTSPELAISALWTLYEEQAKALDELPTLASVARTIDFPLIPVLARMEHRGIKLDSQQLMQMNTEITQELKRVEEQMYELAGYQFNIASPAQLSEVLFTKLQLPTNGIKRGKTSFSTGQSELDKLRSQHPIIELIERSRELAKLQNTYVAALPKLADENGRVHTTFNQDVAATGRLSSTDPNLQNIPVRTDLGRRIRDAFIPEKGNVFVNADYSQFELRLAAVLAGDEAMINDFNAGTDIHAKTASQVYKVPLDDVTKTQRSNAKVVNFGVLYGMSIHGLTAASGMNFAEAKAFIDEYNNVRHKLVEYTKAVVQKAREVGYVETLYGRRRPTPDVHSSNFVVRQAAERAAANMPIQGTEADLMKKAMVQIDSKIDGLGYQLLQVHDSILIECSKANADKIAEILQDTMENIAPDLGVRLQVDVHVGNNWGEV